MKYFEAESVIHRSLCAKHILVAADGTVKIGHCISARRIVDELGYEMGQGVESVQFHSKCRFIPPLENSR